MMYRFGSGWKAWAGTVLWLSVVCAQAQTVASAGTAADVQIHVDGEGMGVRYLGRCEPAATLLIEPVYLNQTDRAMRALEPTPMLPPFERVARRAASQYEAACPGVRSIRFALEPLPNAQRCLQGTECFVVLTRNGDRWDFDSAQMGYPPPALTVQTLTDVAEVMAAGRLDLVTGVPTLYAFFAASFLESYGEHCASQLKDPVVLEIQTVRTTRHGNGPSVSTPEGAPSRIPLERGLVEHYKAQRAAAMQGGVAQALGGGNAVAYIQTMVVEAGALDADLQERCKDARIRTTYGNLKQALLGLPLETGKFETSLVARDSGTPSGSAPAFATQYRNKRQATEQARAAAAAAAALPPGVDMPQPMRPPRGRTSPGAAPDMAVAPEQVAQVRELSNAYRQKVAELKASYTGNIQAARTPQERTDIMRDYNDKLLALLQEHRHRMQALTGR